MKRYLHYLLLGAGAVVAFVILTNLIIHVSTKSHIYKNINDVPKAQAVVIPGAAIFPDGALSSIFKDRVDKAISIYKEGKVSKILVSGDNSTVSHNEVNPVRNYLLEKGIPDADIFLDHAGFDTYSTMYRARDIFKVESIIVSTQAFHLPRSVFIARMLGITAYGVPAETENILFKNYVREALADEKAVMNLLLHRKPKFLGDTIPITGDGRNYP